MKRLPDTGRIYGGKLRNGIEVRSALPKMKTGLFNLLFMAPIKPVMKWAAACSGLLRWKRTA